MNAALVYLATIGLTEVVEAPIYATILSRCCGARPRRAVLASVIVNLISNPLFSFAWLPLGSRFLTPTETVIVGEVLVCVVEAALIYAWLRRDLPFVIVASLVANACSFTIGLLVL